MANDSGQLRREENKKKQEQQKRARELRSLKQKQNKTAKKTGVAGKQIGGAVGQAGGAAAGGAAGAVTGAGVGAVGGAITGAVTGAGVGAIPGAIAGAQTGATTGAKIGSKAGGMAGKKAGQTAGKQVGKQAGKAPYRLALAAKKQRLNKARREGQELRTARKEAEAEEGAAGGGIIDKVVFEGAQMAKEKAKKAIVGDVKKRAALIGIPVLVVLTFMFLILVILPLVIMDTLWETLTDPMGIVSSLSTGE